MFQEDQNLGEVGSPTQRWQGHDQSRSVGMPEPLAKIGSPSVTITDVWLGTGAQRAYISQPPLPTGSGQVTKHPPVADDTMMCRFWVSVLRRNHTLLGSTVIFTGGVQKSLSSNFHHTHESHTPKDGCRSMKMKGSSVWIDQPSCPPTSGPPHERETNVF